MLILYRREGERILIGNEAEISFSILSVDGGCFRIGINAPRNVPVYREEVWKKMKYISSIDKAILPQMRTRKYSHEIKA